MVKLIHTKVKKVRFAVSKFSVPFINDRFEKYLIIMLPKRVADVVVTLVNQFINGKSVNRKRNCCDPNLSPEFTKH